jgi:lactate dehydrogenase-like 2-hydroxyacid dehydrogenase
MPFNVYVTRMIPQTGIDYLQRNCDRVDINPEDRVLTPQELLQAVKGRDGVLCLLTDRIDAEVFDAAGGAKVFANMAVGYDNIDVPCATRQGIVITNTPGVLTDATSDFAWALLFSITRRVVEADKFTRAGKFVGWGPLILLGGDITGKTLGIIGAGRIGHAVALKSAGFKMKVLYADIRQSEELEEKIGARRVSLEELLKESDFVSIHVNLTPETRHLIAAPQLKLMKPSAYLINTSRGPVIDEAALARALKEKRLAGAALDVYEEEPKVHPELMELDNVVLAPHIASATIESRGKMALMAAENLVAVLRGESPKNCVNPEVLKST